MYFCPYLFLGLIYFWVSSFGMLRAATLAKNLSTLFKSPVLTESSGIYHLSSFGLVWNARMAGIPLTILNFFKVIYNSNVSSMSISNKITFDGNLANHSSQRALIFWQGPHQTAENFKIIVSWITKLYSLWILIFIQYF